MDVVLSAFNHGKISDAHTLHVTRIVPKEEEIRKLSATRLDAVRRDFRMMHTTRNRAGIVSCYTRLTN